LILAGTTPTITVSALGTGKVATISAETTVVNGGIIKEGNGYLSLNANNTFTGGITINGGRVRLAPLLATLNGFTGGITVNSGATLWMYSVGASSTEFNNAYGPTSNAFAVNGGTILASYNSAQDRTLTDHAIIIGTGGATIDVAATSYTNFAEDTQHQLRITNAAGVFTGTTSLTKSGGGRLTLNNDSPGFSGPVVVNNGTFEAVQRAGDGSATNTVTINGGNATLTGNPTQPAFTLNGGAISSQDGARTVSGTVNVTAASHVFLNDFYQDTGGARNMTIAGKLSGSAALSVEVNRSGHDANSGTLRLQNTANDYSGTISVGKNLRLENNAAAGAGKTIGTAAVALASGRLVLRDNGTGTNGVLAYGNNVTLVAPSGILNNGDLAGQNTLDVDRSSGTNTGNTFRLGTLTFGAGVTSLDVIGGNGYGAQFTGLTTFSGDATINATTADLTLSGGNTGGANLIKTGAGKLTLEGTSGYAGTTTINGGVVQFNSVASIGGTGASITVSAGGAAAAGYAIDQAFIDRVVNSSAGVIAAAASSPNNLSLAGYTAARLGAVGAAELTGTLTPDGTAYRLGGGTTGHVLTLSNANALTGTRTLDVWTSGTGAGVVALTSSNDFTGLVIISGGELLRPQTNASLGAPANFIMGDGGGIQFATGAPFDLFASRTTIFGSGGFILDTNGNDYTQPTAINGAGTGGFIKSGAGVLTLSAASTFSGGTVVAGGVLAVDADAKFGASSSVSISGGTLRYAGATGETVAHTYNFNSGTVEITNAAANVTIAGIVGGTGTSPITKAGAGTLTLTNTANAFTAPIVVDGGVVAYTGQGNANPTVLGAGTKNVTLQNGGVLRPLSASDPSATTKSFIIGSGGGTFDTPTGVTFTLNDAGQLAGSGTLTKTGAGTLALGQASTGYAGYTGAIILSGGQTNIYHANSLGDTAAGTTVAAGATLELSGTVTIAEPLTIAGNGATGGGALRTPASAVTGTVTGPITLSSDALIIASSTSTMNLNNAAAITGVNRNVTLSGIGTGNIRGAVALGAGSLTKTATGTWAFAGADGVLSSASALNILGGTILLNNDGGVDVTTAANGNRLPDSMPVTLVDNNALELRGLNRTAPDASSETVGAINFDGQAFVKFSTVTPTFTTTTLSATLGSRIHNGVLFVQASTGGTLGTTDRLIAANPVLLNGGTMVAPYYLNPTTQNFFTHGAGGFADAAFTSTDLNTAVSTDIVNQGATAVALSGNRSAFAVKLGTGAVTGNTLTIGSGGLIAAGAATHTSNITFNDGTQNVEGIVYVPTGVTAILTGTVTASALTKVASGTLTLGTAATTNYTTLANSPLNVLAGTVSLPGAGNTANVYAFGPTYLATGATLSQSSAANANSITLGGLSGAGTITCGTNGTGVNTLTINQKSAGTFSGAINKNSRSNVTKLGTAQLNFTGAVNISDILAINFGELVFSGAGTFPSSAGQQDRQRGRIQQGGTLTLDNTATNVADRMSFNLDNTNATKSNDVTLLIQGGTFNFLGNSTVNSSETIGKSAGNQNGFGAGAGVINVAAGAGRSAVLTFTNSFIPTSNVNNAGTIPSAGRAAGASALIRGTNLGGTQGAADTASVVWGGSTILTGFNGGTGTGTQIGVLKGVVADSVIAGADTYGLATYDTGADATPGNADDPGVRRLAAGEMATTITSGDTTTLNNVLVNSAITGIDAATTVNALHFAGGSIAGSGTLTVNSGTVLAANNGAAGANSLDVATLAFTGGEAIVYAVSDLTISSAIGGTTALTKGGPGVVTLSGTNGFTGNVVINGGLVAIDSTARLGIAANTVALNNGGGLRATGSFSLARTVTLGAAGGVIDVTGANVLSIGTVIGGGPTSAPSATALTKTGTGTLELTAANTYTGGTTLSAGTLRAANTTGSATGTGTVTLNGGTLSSGSAGTISGAVLAGSGPHVIDPGTTAAATLALGGGLTTNGNTTLHFDLFGAFSGDLLSINGLTVGAGTQIAFDANPSAIGNYRLITGAFGSPLLSNFVLPSQPSGKSYTLDATVDPGYIDLVVASSTLPAGSGTWTHLGSDWLWTNSNNWAYGVPQAAGHVATFSGAGLGTVNLGGDKTVGKVALDAASGGYILGAAATTDKLYMDNGGTDNAEIRASTGAHVVNALVTTVAGKNLDVIATGSGSLSLSGGIDNAGVMTVSGAVSAGAVVGAGTTTVTANSSLTATSIVQDTLSLQPGGVLTIRSTASEGEPLGSAVPEPGTLVLLLAFAAAGLLARSCRRRKS